jgi:hypothetical protein
VVNWLFTKVQGFTEKREAKKYASQMLKTGFIKHTVNKVPIWYIYAFFTLITHQATDW